MELVEVNKHRLIDYSNDAFSCIANMVNIAGQETEKKESVNQLLVEAIHTWCSIHPVPLSAYSSIIPFLIVV